MNPSILNISVFTLLVIFSAGSVFLYYFRRSKEPENGDIYWISRDMGGVGEKSMLSSSPQQNYESNVSGIFIAGELAGSQSINEAIEQGSQAVEQISQSLVKQYQADYDLVIVGAGPTGISAALAAKSKDMRFILLEQDTLAGAIINHSEESISVNKPLNIPMEGKVMLKKGTKAVLISLWHHLILKYLIPLQEYSRVESIINLKGYFTVISTDGQNFTTSNVLLATGLFTQSGKLNIPGENRPKVEHRLSEPRKIIGKNILIIGGNDNAIEAAMMLSENNRVTLSFKKEKLDNSKPLDNKLLGELFRSDRLEILLKTNPVVIDDENAVLYSDSGNIVLPNDLVYIFNDKVESTRNFLERCGVKMFNVHQEKAIRN